MVDLYNDPATAKQVVVATSHDSDEMEVVAPGSITALDHDKTPPLKLENSIEAAIPPEVFDPATKHNDADAQVTNDG